MCIIVHDSSYIAAIITIIVRYRRFRSYVGVLAVQQPFATSLGGPLGLVMRQIRLDTLLERRQVFVDHFPCAVGAVLDNGGQASQCPPAYRGVLRFEVLGKATTRIGDL